jgi:predicted nucleic acid-binding protein
LSRGIADTSVFIARESGRPLAETDLPDELAISVITIGELRSGVLAAVDVETRDRRLATLSEALALDPLPVDQAVAEAWARLRVLLRDMQKRIPVNDSWIAATAMSLGVPVVTQDEDYVEVPGLKIVRV